MMVSKIGKGIEGRIECEHQISVVRYVSNGQRKEQIEWYVIVQYIV